MSPQLEEKTSVCEFLFSCMYGQTVFLKKSTFIAIIFQSKMFIGIKEATYS